MGQKWTLQRYFKKWVEMVKNGNGEKIPVIMQFCGVKKSFHYYM